MSFVLIFCVLSPSISPVLAVPFWKQWTQSEEITVPEARRTQIVSILVAEDLLEDNELSTKIERYGVDVQQAIVGQVILVPVAKDASPLDLWNGNAQLYFSGHNNDHKSQLIGTVIIGDVPLPVVDKEGKLHATPFPYTDFEEPSYFWDTNKDRFVWQSGGDEQPEIWHGVIRSDRTTERGKIQDLKSYFDRNHRIHTGQETVSKKIFLADIPSQRRGISDEQKEMYQKWIDHLEDFSYLRFNKNWLNGLFEEVNPSADLPIDLLPESMQDADTSADFSAMPDVQTKLLIDQMAQRYLEAAREKIVEILSPAGESGRWEAGEMDTTIGLIAKKDEWAAQILREANDEVENIFREKLTDSTLNIPATRFLKTEHKYQPYETILGINTPFGTPITKELYINGVKLSEIDLWGWDVENQEMKLFDQSQAFPAENCSIFRGTASDEEHPAGQLAELNRVYNFETAALSTCIDWDGDDTDDSDRKGHEYEGCCAQNISFGGNGFDLSAPNCTVNNGWSPVFDCERVENWQCGLSVLEYPLPLLIDWEYIGATKPVFDIKGSRAVTEGIIGAEGCESFFEEEGDSENQKEISTLMFHDEPRLETLQAQASAQSTNAMPADDPRGASFYDSADVFHRINFPSAFDFIGQDVEIILQEEKESFFSSKLEQSLLTTITNIDNTAGNSGKIVETDFDVTLWKNTSRQQEVLDALLWLGKDLEQKHGEMIRGVLSGPLDAARILGAEDFDGYEILEIIGETAEYDAIRLEFEKGDADMESSNTFRDAEKESQSFIPISQENWIEEERTEEALPEGWSAKEETGCSEINLLTWPTKCLIPWAASLPDSFSKTLSLPFDVPFSKEEQTLLLEGNIPVAQEVASLEVSPKKIIIAANDVMPITISVEIKDEAGNFVKSPQEVSLNATSTDALDFFTLSPSGTRIATGGKTQFRLVPKTRAFGGKFSFQVSVGDIQTEIPVSVTQTKMVVSVDASSVIAGETEEVRLKINTLDGENKITNIYDGKWITLTSSLGTFMGGERVKFKNGTAEISFFPGTKSGENIILIQDEQKILPKEQISFEILPSVPADIKLESPLTFVRNGVPAEINALVTDRFGNIVFEDVPSVEWNISESHTAEKNTAFVSTSKTDDVEILATLPKIKSSVVQQKIPVVDYPQLLVDVQNDALVAGKIDPVFIPVLVEGNLPGTFEINVLVTGEAGIFPEKIKLLDGIGQLPFAAGTKSGRSTIQLQAAGFGSTTFILDVLPAEPHKIEMSTDRTVLQIGDERRNTLSVRGVDRFGNEVPFVSDEISFFQNPGEKWEGSDIDELESLGVIDENSSVKSYLEEQLVSTELETNPVVTFDPASPKITNGTSEVEIQTTEEKSGHVFLVATAKGLIPDTLELDVVRVLKQEEWSDTLSPKSLLTLFLGNAGGRLDKHSFGNRFLFDGKTQAVATLLEEPFPNKTAFSFDPSGDFVAQKITADSGNKFSFRIDDVARGIISFVQNPEWNKTDGWNFLPQKGTNISIKKESLWLENQKIITLLPKGGFYLEADTEIVATDSWKTWDIYFQGEKQGSISLSLETDEIFVDKTSIPGVFFESLSPEIYIESSFTGKSTTSALGRAGLIRKEIEDIEKTLQSSRISAEDALEEEGVGWITDWKPGTLFAAGNNVGESVRIAASDAIILLGDPTITRGEKSQTNDAGFTDDIGKVIWSSPFGAIDQVLVADVNGDGRSDIFSRIGNKLFALYHDRHQLDNFRDTGLFLRFADGAQKLDVHIDTQGNLLHFLQLNDAGEIILHTNKNQGTFIRQSLDVGIQGKIIDFDVVELNGDMYSDLILLDDQNVLWFAYGKKEQWYAAQQVESFAASFEKIDEKYIAANEQSYPKTEETKFPQLDDFSFRFASLSENSTWSGETKNIQNKSFISLSDSRDFDARYQVDVENEKEGYSVVPGKRFSHSLKLSGNQLLVTEGELLIPQSVGFRFEENSFLCNGCQTFPEVQKTSRVVQILIGDIPAHANITFQWETIAEEIPPIRYMVNDFEGNDGIDDIAIAWQSDSTAQTIQFLSTGSGIVPAKSGGTPASPFLRTHRRTIEEVFPDLLPSDFDAEATVEDVFECLSTQQNDDGIPTILTTRSIEESLGDVVQKEKKASWIDAIPSVVFLAPGPQSIYIPPFSIPIPIPAFGMPILWVGPSPPFVGTGINPTSLFRLYVMPTTSLQVGLGICGGPVIDPTMTPTGVPFPPQCVVIVPQFSSGSSNSSFGGTGGGTSGSSMESVSCTELAPANEATAQQELFQQLYAPVGDGRTRLDFSVGVPFTMKPMRASTNRQIKAADILSQWVQDQWRELTNFKFPKFRLKLPKFKTSPSTKEEPVLSQLKKSPFIDIQTKKITINYPSFSDEALERAGKDMKQWKKDSQKKLEQTMNEWNKVGCESFENGTWNNATESCDSSPESSAALEILVQLSKHKMEATIIRLQSMRVALSKMLLTKKKETLEKEINTENEEIIKDENSSFSELQSKIRSQQEKIKKYIESPEIENQKTILEQARDQKAELKAIVTETEALQSDVLQQKRAETKAFLSQKSGGTTREVQQFNTDLTSDIFSVEKISKEIDTLFIEGHTEMIDILLTKINVLENVSKEEKESIENDSKTTSTELEELRKIKKEKLQTSALEKSKERTKKTSVSRKEKKDKMKSLKQDIRSEAKDIFQSMALDPLAQKWEEFGISVDKNFESLRSYVTEIKKLKTVPKKLKKLLEQVKGMADVINEYWSEWIEKNERAVKKWEEFGSDTKKTIQTWKEIPEILKKFAKATSSSNGGSMTRGTLLAWLKNFILSAIKFPIIPMPQVPDIEIDLSEVKIGVKLEIPELEFNAVEVSPDMTPPIPNFEVIEKFNGIFAGLLESSWKTLTLDGALEGIMADISLQIETGELSPEALESFLQSVPSVPEAPDLLSSFDSLESIITSFENLIPVVPALPEAPSLPDMAFEMPPLVLPQLPSLIEPPKFPDFLKIPNLIMLVPKYLLSFLSLISRGIMPVPEWMVAMTVVNATNRTLLLPIDFLPEATLPQVPKLVLPPLSYKLKWDFAQGIPSLIAALESSAAMFNSVTTQLSNASKGLSIETVVPATASPIPITRKENDFSVVSLLPETDFLEQQEAIDTQPIKTLVFDTTLQNNSPTRSWVASTSPKILSLDDYPQDVSSTYDMSSVPDAGDEIVVEPRILWFDADKNTTETVTTFPLRNRRFSTQRVDFDRDGEDEIVYSIGEQLFIKRRVEPLMTEEEEDAEFEIPQNILEWDFDYFVGRFSPSQIVNSSVEANGASFQFLPDPTNDARYFEWIVSDRPDRIFESSTSANTRMSKVWRRVGFLVRPPATKYEIRPVGAQIQSVEGNPIMYGTSLKTVEKFDNKQCLGGETVLPFFAEETLFVGAADKSRLLIKTLARKGQIAETREIELRKGEETVVDFAEVCVSRGDVQYIEIGKAEKLIPKKDNYFFSGMRLELGEKDKVELDLFDNTNVTIWGGEQYELHQFVSREEMISTFKQLSRENYYGQLLSFQGKNKSWTRSKYFLHDPQTGDDIVSPQLEVIRGTNRSVLLGQKIEIDASHSYENQEWGRVWWEVKGKTVIDSDSEKYAPLELLTISLPPEYHTGSFPVVLHATDISGNSAELELTIEVNAPKLEIREASARDTQILGKVDSRKEGIEVWFIRERDGRQEVLSRSTKSKSDGTFIIEDLSQTGGAILRDQYTKKPCVEILETGRPVLANENLTQIVSAAKEDRPLHISLREKNGEDVANITFIAPKQERVLLPTEEGILQNITGTEIKISNPQKKRALWRSRKNGISELVEPTTQEIIGTVDTQGQFKTEDPEVYLKIKSAINEKAPLIFEIWKGKYVLAQFSMPSPEKIKIKEEISSLKIQKETNENSFAQ